MHRLRANCKRNFTKTLGPRSSGFKVRSSSRSGGFNPPRWRRKVAATKMPPHLSSYLRDPLLKVEGTNFYWAMGGRPLPKARGADIRLVVSAVARSERSILSFTSLGPLRSLTWSAAWWLWSNTVPNFSASWIADVKNQRLRRPRYLAHEWISYLRFGVTDLIIQQPCEIAATSIEFSGKAVSEKQLFAIPLAFKWSDITMQACGGVC